MRLNESPFLLEVVRDTFASVGLNAFYNPLDVGGSFMFFNQTGETLTVMEGVVTTMRAEITREAERLGKTVELEPLLEIKDGAIVGWLHENWDRYERVGGYKRRFRNMLAVRLCVLIMKRQGYTP